METRAHHLLVGGFVLLFAAAAAVFGLWLAGTSLHREVASYDIFFEESVAGLGLGGDVRYRGIKVGTVASMGLDPRNPTRARVTVEVEGVILRRGDTAMLVLQGITGVLFVNIEGAGPDDPPLVAAEGEPRPVIPSRPSPVSEVFEGVPALLAKAVVALDNLSRIADEENRGRIAAILDNLETSTGALAAREEQASRLLDSLERTMVDFEAVGGALRGTLETAGELVESEGKPLVGELRETLADLRRLLGETEVVLAENRQPLADFTQQDLPELAAVAADSRLLLRRLTGLVERLEREGAGVLLRPEPREVEVAP